MSYNNRTIVCNFFTIWETKSNCDIDVDRKNSKFAKMRGMKSLLIMMYAVTLTPTPSLSFTQISRVNKRRPLSRRHYRFEGAEIPSYTTEDIMSGKNALHTVQMPVWLRQHNDEDADQILSELNVILSEKNLSSWEAKQIITTIRMAAKQNKTKMAGAARLCRILIETMDMDIDTIISAAYHYCSCFESRERMIRANQYLSKPSTTFISALWDTDQRDDVGLQNLTPEIAQIVHDTAKLKRTEMIASSVVQSTDFDSLRALLLSETRDWRALAIRLAASLYRLRGVIQAQSSLTESKYTSEDKQVAREALHVFAPLASQLGMYRLKNELEGNAFRILYKRQYKTVNNLMNQKREINSQNGLTLSDGMQSVIADITEEVKNVLKNDPLLKKYTENIVVTARVKQPFSLWKKMLIMRTKKPLHVSDALALRIVVSGKKQSTDEDDEVTRNRETKLCYYVKKICTRRWVADSENSRFKNYIQRPKKNGYQSLHYSARTRWNGDDWNCEFQIRSKEMHRVAEYGSAAHWDYKHGNKESERAENEQGNKNHFQLDHNSDAYLKSAHLLHWQQLGNSHLEIMSSFPKPQMFQLSSRKFKRREKIRTRRLQISSERLAPYIESFSNLLSKLRRNQVFVFLSPADGSIRFDGKIISLPSGSCVIDALRQGEKLFGMTANFQGPRVYQNDKETFFTERLRNGDVLKFQR